MAVLVVVVLVVVEVAVVVEVIVMVAVAVVMVMVVVVVIVGGQDVMSDVRPLCRCRGVQDSELGGSCSISGTLGFRLQLVAQFSGGSELLAGRSLENTGRLWIESDFG